jgi:ferredoxin
VHNLATYLNPRRSQVAELGTAALVVKGCDAKAVAGLLREAQLERDRIVLIGVRCGGVVTEPTAAEAPELTAENVASRCWSCDVREPGSVDYLVGEAQAEPPVTDALDARIAELDALSPQERFAFWAKEMERCTQCYACRQACPLCFCERCIVEKTQPQWIETSPHPRGNFAWHLTRAQHLAGRCVGCGECERACPVGIPLSLINRKLQQVVYDLYGYTVSEDPSVPAPIGAYAVDDTQDFIT